MTDIETALKEWREYDSDANILCGHLEEAMYRYNAHEELVRRGWSITTWDNVSHNGMPCCILISNRKHYSEAKQHEYLGRTLLECYLKAIKAPDPRECSASQGPNRVLR